MKLPCASQASMPSSARPSFIRLVGAAKFVKMPRREVPALEPRMPDRASIATDAAVSSSEIPNWAATGPV